MDYRNTRWCFQCYISSSLKFVPAQLSIRVTSKRCNLLPCIFRTETSTVGRFGHKEKQKIKKRPCDKQLAYPRRHRQSHAGHAHTGPRPRTDTTTVVHQSQGIIGKFWEYELQSVLNWWPASPMMQCGTQGPHLTATSLGRRFFFLYISLLWEQKVKFTRPLLGFHAPLWR